MYQSLTLVGNLGKDPEMRYTPSGKPVTSFSVATSHQYTNNNGEIVKETAWFRITTWGKTAENCNQYLKKGSKVLIEGRLTADLATGGPRVWSGQDGTPRASFEVNATTVKFLSARGDSDGGGGGDMMGGGGGFIGAPDDDIPF